jgi:hypothetical protein
MGCMTEDEENFISSKRTASEQALHCNQANILRSTKDMKDEMRSL